jgi:hypothetical protein
VFTYCLALFVVVVIVVVVAVLATATAAKVTSQSFDAAGRRSWRGVLVCAASIERMIESKNKDKMNVRPIEKRSHTMEREKLNRQIINS